jgi:hypothetical protein
MRELKYISPTSRAKFYSDRSEFYLNYLADHRPERPPQTQPMSVGSAFDAYIKSYLTEKLHGTVPEGFGRDELFEKQVEKHNWDWAREHGAHIFRCYLRSGALADLLTDLQHASQEPRFEVRVEGRIPHEDVIDGIPLLGLPDLFFISKEMAHIIYDWKVNGYCASRPTSPKKGYVMVRDGWKSDEAPPSRNANQAHKSAQTMRIDGVTVNIADYFENVYEPWAAQLATYAWVLGEPVGSAFIVGVDQLVAIPQVNKNPRIRVAAHRMRVSADYQHRLLRQYAVMWNLVREGPRAIFLDQGMTPDESEGRCKLLDDMHLAFAETGDEKDIWFNKELRGGNRPY